MNKENNGLEAIKIPSSFKNNPLCYDFSQYITEFNDEYRKIKFTIIRFSYCNEIEKIELEKKIVIFDNFLNEFKLFVNSFTFEMNNYIEKKENKSDAVKLKLFSENLFKAVAKIGFNYKLNPSYKKNKYNQFDDNNNYCIINFY